MSNSLPSQERAARSRRHEVALQAMRDIVRYEDCSNPDTKQRFEALAKDLLSRRWRIEKGSNTVSSVER